MVYRFSVAIEKDADGYYAFCPELQGCYTQGGSYEQTLENIRDAIHLHVEDRLASSPQHPLVPDPLRHLLLVQVFQKRQGVFSTAVEEVPDLAHGYLPV